MTLRVAPRRFYNRPVEVVARELLGLRLIRETADGLLAGRIVEVEAYLAVGDSACHAARGQSKSNAAIFGAPGHAYIYPIHSRHCLNAVTEPAGVPSAVLIRAIEPLEGLAGMAANRGTEKLLNLARGPGRLCEALGLNRELDGWDLTLGEQLWISRDSSTRLQPEQIAVSTRIGVTSAHDLALRFFVAGSRFVSGKRVLGVTYS